MPAAWAFGRLGRSLMIPVESEARRDLFTMCLSGNGFLTNGKPVFNRCGGQMQIPPDAEIAREKLTNYLLVPKPLDDKSRFLGRAGFTPAHPQTLDAAIRALAAAEPAIQDCVNEYGTFWRVEGLLMGPDRGIPVVTIWIQRHADGRFRFITLKPGRK